MVSATPFNTSTHLMCDCACSGLQTNEVTTQRCPRVSSGQCS
jgi:hypothetical protein